MQWFSHLSVHQNYLEHRWLDPTSIVSDLVGLGRGWECDFLKSFQEMLILILWHQIMRTNGLKEKTLTLASTGQCCLASDYLHTGDNSHLTGLLWRLNEIKWIRWLVHGSHANDIRPSLTSFVGSACDAGPLRIYCCVYWASTLLSLIRISWAFYFYWTSTMWMARYEIIFTLYHI